jgi:hypothetical protein
MGGGGASRAEARRAREAEEAREGRIKSGTANIRSMFAQQFGDKYYADMEKTANERYQPQLEDQFQTARKQLMAALARSGNLNSTVRLGREADLGERHKLGLTSIADMIRGAQTQRKQDVANAENIAVGQLQASADPAAAAAQASNLIGANSAMPAFQPLGQVFTDVTAGLATQADLERQGRNRYDVGVSSWFGGPRRYTQTVGG